MTLETVEEAGSPLGRALLLLGDMWTLRIVMLIFLGNRRFQDMRTELSISDPVLSRRLSSLVANQILVMKRYQSSPPRSEYYLTDRGLDLWRTLVAMWSWDRRWAGHQHRDAGTVLRHSTCGHLIRPVFCCGACGAIGVGARDVRGEVDDRLLQDFSTHRSRRSLAMSTPIDATGVLGDRWTTFILSTAFTGTRRFNDFQDTLGISPVTLTQRLNLFLDAGLMQRHEVGSGKRQEYRLTAKSLDFFPVTTIINNWAEDWLSEDEHSGLTLIHIPCEQKILPRHTCNACNGVLERTEIAFEARSLEQ